MDAIEFTDEEIREELARLGYQNVPSDKLVEFKKDLLNLIHSERSKTNSLNSSTEELRSPASPFYKENTEYVSGNFTNHGSQWIEQDYHDRWRNKDGGHAASTSEYREDWHYRGGDKTKQSKKYDILDEKANSKRPTTAPSTSGRQRRAMPASFSNYELPFNVDKERTKKNANQSNILDRCPHDDHSAKNTKRKTCRILQDGCRRVDESFCDSETEGIFEVYEKIKSMAMRDCECGKTKSTSSEEEPPYRIKGKNECPSVIFKKNGPPHQKNIVRTKPFERMKMYRKMWKQQPPIGEDNRTELHKEMHAKMVKKDEIKKAHKVYVPNLYEVPTLKARDNLRWKVRTAMETYQMPPHGFYHEI